MTRAALAALMTGTPACASVGWTPYSATRAAKRNAASTSAQAQRVFEALGAAGLGSLHAELAPALARRTDVQSLQRASARIAAELGRPVGIVEERVHAEGELSWYVGLWAMRPDRESASASRGRATRLLALTFALDPGGKIVRFQAREHPFSGRVEVPATEYETLNRWRLPAAGDWTVLQGGTTLEKNKHHPSRTQRWAYDLVVKKAGRTRPRSVANDPRNHDFYCYGEPLFAPAPGVVVRAKDGVEENVPRERGKGGGNGVVIDHGFGEYSELWHMIPGTVRVKVGDVVEVGQELGLVGNSGASTTPHIHFHVTLGPPGSDGRFGLPARFSDVVVDGGRFSLHMPQKGQRVRNDRRTRGPQEPRAFIDL